MTARSIFLVTILVLLESSGCYSLSGGEDAVCHEIENLPQYHGYSRPYTNPFHSHYQRHMIFDGDHLKYEEDPWSRSRPALRLVEKCCVGYVEIDGSCEPKCLSKCENGYCAEPYRCGCNDGYQETILSQHCIPICEGGCIFGTCTSPNNCTCDEGYSLDADGTTCEPVCSSTCENGFCLEPELCHCFPGYKRNDANECQPVCKLGCENGKCVDPNICECNHGYESPPGNNSVCVPRCKHPCEFGTCTAPNNCTCDDRYQPTLHPYVCEPKCKSPCSHGWCSAPDVCECYPGYKKSEGNECLPVCDKPCKNGTCVAPDTCACSRGFEKSKDDASVCQPRCSRPCSSGKCTAPETCTCDIGHRLGVDKYTCEPVCDMTCEKGYCAEPNVCGCHRGYKKNATNGCDPVCQISCINGKCVDPDRCECDVGFQPMKENVFACEPMCSQPCGFGAICTSPETCTCNEGEARNGSCADSLCKTSCNQGICTSKGCDCDYGWDGDSCDEPLFCIVIQPLNVNLTNPQNELADTNQTELMEESYDLKWKRPTCHTKCLEQLDTTAVNFTLTTRNETLHLIAIDSSCNTVRENLKSSRMSSGAIGAVLGVVLLVAAAIIGVVIFVRMRQRPRENGFAPLLVNECEEVDLNPS